MTAGLRDRGPGRRSSLALGGDTGATLIEVIVSAMLVAVIAMGAFAAIEAASRTTADERHRLEAHGLAERDQARLRAMKISTLSNLREVRTVTVSETDAQYTIESRGEFVSNSTGTTSCTGDDARADYIRIRSTVTWPSLEGRPPVVVESIVAPPNGSIGEDRGALAITVMDAEGNGIPGVGLQGVGAGSFSGTTDENGCALFGNLPEGNYTLTPTGIAGGLVDRDGNPPGQQTTSVVGQSTNQVTLQFAEPGSANVSFRMRNEANQLVAASTESVMVFHTGMTAAKRFNAPGSGPATTITAQPLFPFTSPVTIYAGACTGDNPNPNGSSNPPGAPAIATATIPPGGTANAQIQLPALHVNVFWRSSSTSAAVPAPNSRVVVRDRNCNNYARTYTTDSNGQLHNVALPYSDYDVCAEVNGRRQTGSNIAVKSFTAAGTVVNVTVVGGFSGSPSGSCPT